MFPPYPEYKESGIQWLGNLPSHWSVVQMRRLFSLVNGATPPSGYDEYWDGGITWVTPEDLSKTETNWIAASKRTLSEQGYRACGVQLVRPGSLVVSIRAPVGYVAIASVSLCTNQGCRGLQATQDVDSRFYMYWILSCREILQSLSGGSTFQELSSSAFSAVPTVRPRLDEQQKIAAFLDHETARIDALIEEQKRLIELLKEKRQAVISHAVTKGLDPDVPMKDSGVEWLGEVPTHWGVLPLRRLVAGIEQGWSPEADNNPATTDQWGVIKLSAVSRGRFYPEENKAIPEDQPSRPGLRIKKGDLLITRANTPELVGDVAFVEEAPNNLILCDLCYRLDTCDDRVDRRFLRYVMLSDHMRAQISSDARGSSGSMVKISHGMIKSWLIPVPPLDEQKRIAQRIAEELGALASTQEAATQLVERLRERRSALISAAVTGKIDVRDWQPPAGEDELRATAHEDAEA